MKSSEILFEGPYHIDRDAPAIKLSAFPSIEGLRRENQFLGKLDRLGREFNFWLSTSKGSAKVTTEAKDDIRQVRQKVVVDLIFQKSASLPVDNEIQVDSVRTDPAFTGGWLAGTLYIVLARYGFTVVSDFTQYNGGKALWKKLATESTARKYVVKVWDDESGDWVCTTAGDIVQYNVANLADDAVWKDIDCHDEATTLLVLSHS